jgi:predicted membrane GTPase involved in stress response
LVEKFKRVHNRFQNFWLSTLKIGDDSYSDLVGSVISRGEQVYKGMMGEKMNNGKTLNMKAAEKELENMTNANYHDEGKLTGYHSLIYKRFYWYISRDNGTINICF